MNYKSCAVYEYSLKLDLLKRAALTLSVSVSQLIWSSLGACDNRSERRTAIFRFRNNTLWKKFSPVSEYCPQLSAQADLHQHVDVLLVPERLVQPANTYVCHSCEDQPCVKRKHFQPPFPSGPHDKTRFLKRLSKNKTPVGRIIKGKIPVVLLAASVAVTRLLFVLESGFPGLYDDLILLEAI